MHFMSITFLLGFLSSVTLAAITPGTYYIVNRVAAPHGPQLAVTFVGDGMPASITGRTASLTQQWIFSDSNDGTQTITSASSKSLGATEGENHVVTLGNLHAWNVIQTPDGYHIIRNPGGSAKWGITGTNSDSLISIGTVLGQRAEWIIEAV